ncbi:hypothetical protein TA5114_01773 [Cognatishimia activa]|uniref:Uncharacterized protein n=1 Tax=Cognatishimia activa TaxID=1715691 RepID=A0A0N7MBP3_9RHOB|nr:hypothetical protein TA5113_02253 [Cognatishimia activa]CUK25968.1 hypothetical protein TA5114_01773 [Cognatishimia activa]
MTREQHKMPDLGTQFRSASRSQYFRGSAFGLANAKKKTEGFISREENKCLSSNI